MRPPAVLADRGDTGGHVLGRERDRTAVAERAEVFGRIEAKGGGVAEGADLLSMPSGPMRLGAILDQGQTIRSADSADGVEVGCLPV